MFDIMLLEHSFRGCFFMTGEERRIYDAICQYIAVRGCAPTVREIGLAVGLGSVPLVYYYLNRIMDQGYITFHPGRPRSLQVLK